MNKLISTGIIFILIILLFCSCSNNIAGGTSEQGNANTISGTVYDTLGVGVENVFIRILPKDYNPAENNFSLDSITAITDSNGCFELKHVVKGIYCLSGMNSTGLLYCSKKTIVIDTTDIDAIETILHEPGYLKVPIDSTIWQGSTIITVYIPGTNIHKTITKEVKVLSFDNVPSETYSLMVYRHLDNKDMELHEDFNRFFVMSGVLMDFSLYPVKPNGPKTVEKNSTHKFYTMFKYWDVFPDIEVQFIEYRFSWGDGDTSSWSNALSTSHLWTDNGMYKIRVQTRYLANDKEKRFDKINPFYSGWSDKTGIEVEVKTY